MESKKYYSLDELPVVLTVDDLMSVLCVGRNTAYDLVRSGQIKSLRIGHQIRIPREYVAEFISGSAA